ncbi:sirohydrochlorin chelatase [Jidongwangia harbinensis]|uniref:sirohydrochlorin chelatase n=1 Tax=Jidongwangia harbinensis TaxID=2878561 RepID=UPI001CDA3B98|nr:CbiX/SirB N-terminal domain-containing protein [Jidongwangia harbinensis]MCA2213424.1 cobalamin biosynthesis protein CbiX [Jidongwangia harbinensis]
MRPARLAVGVRGVPLERSTGVVLIAHGSRDPRAAAATEALTRAVADAHPEWVVRASYLDHAGPRPLDVLTRLEAAGHRRAVLVPVLLTAAYHGKVDVPAVVTDAHAAGLRLTVDITDVLGPGSATLLDGLIRRLPDADLDAVVLAAAGTRDAAARATVADAATALGARLGLPCTVAYASAAPPTGAEAVQRLQAAGARRIGVAGYFLAPGRLYDGVVASAVSAGAVAVAQPLGDAPELVRLVEERVYAQTSGLLAA